MRSRTSRGDASLRDRLLLFHGPETRAREEALTALIAERLPEEDRDLNLEFHDGGEPGFSPAAVLQGARQVGMFSAARVVVVRRAERLREARHERARQLLAEGLCTVPPTATVVFIAGSDDEGGRRPAGGPLGEPLTGVIKELGRIENFPFLKSDALGGRLKQEAERAGKRLTAPAAALLAQRAGPELGRALLELDKLVSYAGERQEITEEDVGRLVPGSVEESIFALLNHVALGNRRQAVDTLRRLLEGGEPAARILPMVGRTLRQLMQAKFLREHGVRSGSARESLPDALRGALPADGDLYASAAQPWQRERLWDQSGRLSWEQLRAAVDALALADAGAKGWESGPQDPELAAELLVIRLSSRAR